VVPPRVVPLWRDPPPLPSLLPWVSLLGGYSAPCSAVAVVCDQGFRCRRRACGVSRGWLAAVVPTHSCVRSWHCCAHGWGQVRNSARIFGDPVLYRKMEAASQAIKRDICFASSLYIA
jgi:hypothetical protein